MKFKYLILILPILAMLYVVGPKASSVNLDELWSSMTTSESLDNLSQVIAIIHQESIRDDLRPNNEAQIIWADKDKQAKTSYAVVYLHGFSASHHEGYPLHENIAKAIGANLLKARLHAHGFKDVNHMNEFTAEDYLGSVYKAIQMGKLLGDKVILISCSTGSTASLYFASKMDDIAGLILLSPNVELADPTSKLITKPWGKQILHAVVGDTYSWEGPEQASSYWYMDYTTSSLVELMRLMEATMISSTYAGVHQPLFMAYWYKNKDIQDDVVSVSAALHMFDQLASKIKVKRAYPNANGHVVASDIMNPQHHH